MRFIGTEQRLQLDKWYDQIFPAAGVGGGIGQELEQSFYMAGIKESEMLWNGGSPLRVDDDRALWIWAHGNRHRDAIASGPGQMVTPVKLAKRLDRLDKASTGHLIIWSCFGGYPGGFAEHLARLMGNGGYRHLRIWGAIGLTGHLQRSDDGNQWADVIVAQERVGAALDLALPPPIGRLGKRLFATRDDLNGWGPGLMRPMFRTGLTV